MAARRKTTKKAAPRRRRAAAKATTRRRRSPVRQAGMGVGMKELAFAVVGGLAADYAGDKLQDKVKDPKMRHGLIALTGGLIAYKAPKEFKAFGVGMAVVGGIKTVAVLFPKLLPAGTSAASSANNGGGMLATNKDSASRTIGRMNKREEDIVREAVRYRMENEGIQGRSYSPVTGATRYSPVTGQARRRYS